LHAGKFVVCDRFYDSTIAYQGYGRGLDLAQVQGVIDLAVGKTQPDLTLYLHVDVAISEQRRGRRAEGSAQTRDRFEEADRSFFERVEEGFAAIAAAEPDRVKRIDASQSISEVESAIWQHVAALLD
jgi:dTMP kinase